MNTAAEASLVALRLPPGAPWLAAADAVWEAGDALLPLPPKAPVPVVEQTLTRLRPHAVIDHDGTHTLEGGVAVPRGTAVVVATSGSTGAPKGVVLSHAALHASASASLARLSATRDDRWLCCLPLEHVAGLQVLVRARLAGTDPVIHAEFEVDAVAEQRDVTMVSLVPTMLRRLLDARADVSHLRCVLLGGAAPGHQLLDDAARAGVPVVTTYGMTETCGGCVYDGEPLGGVDVRIADDGHVEIAGPVLFDGYRLDDERTAEVLRDGWLRTSDLGRITDGRLEVLGRADDVIVTGGRNVSGDAVARLLERHPDVVEAAVAAVDDREWGQRVVAFVVARDHQPTLDELRRFVSAYAPAYSAPRELVLVAELPRLASGKVDRLALAALR